MKVQLYDVDWSLFKKQYGVLPATQLEVELILCHEKHPEIMGGVSAMQHRKNVLQLLCPNIYKYWNDWSELCLWAWCNYEELGLTGCVSGRTRILNPLTGEQPTIQYLYEHGIAPVVMTINGAEHACVPVKKEVADIYTVRLADGTSFEATLNHEVMLSGGVFCPLSDLHLGQCLASYASTHHQSNSEHDQLAHAVDDLHLNRTPQGSRHGYRPSFRSYGGQPRRALSVFQDVSPSQAYAGKYIRFSLRQDDRELALQYTHSCLSAFWKIHRLQDSLIGCLNDHRSYDESSHGRTDADQGAFPLSDDARTHNRYLGQGDGLGNERRQTQQHPSEPLLSKQGFDHHNRFSSIPFSHHSSTGISSRLSGSNLRASLFDLATIPACLFQEQGLGSSHNFHKERLVSSYNRKLSQVAIVSIEKTSRENYYDLTVPLSHHYFAEGSIHHNCAAAGKTCIFTNLACIEFLVSPTTSRVALTSTTIPSLRTRLWAEVARCMKPIAPLFGFNIVDSMNKIQSIKGDDQHAIQALAVDSGKVEEAVGKLQGVHCDRQMIIVDEAAQTNPAIFSARANLRVGTRFYRFVAIANASSQFDSHGLFCKPRNGWGSVTADDEFWETQTGICVHFDGLKSPNVKAGKIIVPKLFDLDAIDAVRKGFGENSLQWWSYVRGFWSPSGVRNTVLDAAMIQEGKAQDDVLWRGGGIEILAALDPAWTTGGDDPTLKLARTGIDANGNRVMLEWKRIKIHLEDRTDYPIFYQLADKTIEHLVEHNVANNMFGMDVTGGGAGAADIISQRWKSGFHRVSFGGAASDDPISSDDERPSNKIYANRVSQLWGQYARMVTAGIVRGMDDETAQQFCTRTYCLKNERQLVEPKDEMKKRTNGQSPDAADASVILGEVFAKNFGIAGAVTSSSASDDMDAFYAANRLTESYEG